LNVEPEKCVAVASKNEGYTSLTIKNNRMIFNKPKWHDCYQPASRKRKFLINDIKFVLALEFLRK